MDYSLFPYVIDRASNRIFYVDANGIWYEWHEEHSSGLGALGGFWSVLGQIGAAASFAIPGVGPLVGPLASAAVGAVGAHAAQSAQAKQLGSQWDQLAGQTTALFNQIQAQPQITAADLQRAVEAFNQLDSIAQQANTPWITQQWASSSYRPAFEARLGQIQSSVVHESAPSSQNVLSGGSPSTSGSLTEQVWFWPAVLGIGAFVLLR